MKNLWILTEERPKNEVIRNITARFAKDTNLKITFNEVRISPLIRSGRFTFSYKVFGVECESVNEIIIKTISGKSSFVDFLVFYQESEPSSKDKPLYAIEETKTDDSESRNTGVYQRSSKFVYIDFFYPNIEKIMLYNLKIDATKNPTETNIFGTRLLMTTGVKIMGKILDPKIFRPFDSLEELIDAKDNINKPNYGVPINILQHKDKITISGTLCKSGSLSHDPNIGTISIIAKCIRKLGWEKDIVIVKHGLPSQQSVGKKNKFIKIANKLNIKLENFQVPKVDLDSIYWNYENKSEKLVTIFLHLIVEGYTNGVAIFENHAGCEKGYFITPQKNYLALKKYLDRDQYKSGDKTQIIHIPDLIIYDKDQNEIISIEGKTYLNRSKGKEELNNYDSIENLYIKKFYKPKELYRTLAIYGSEKESIDEAEIGFMLNENGDLVLGPKAPAIFHEAINNLLQNNI